MHPVWQDWCVHSLLHFNPSRTQQIYPEPRPYILPSIVNSYAPELGRPQAVPIRDQHHGGIAMAVVVPASRRDQARNLGIGQVLASADVGVRPAARRVRTIVNCPNNDRWRHQRQMRICHDFSGYSLATVPYRHDLGTLHKSKSADSKGITAIPTRTALPSGGPKWRASL